MIAGGSREESATSAIFSFDSGSGTVRRVGELPGLLTHAAAVAVGRYVYVLGGRGSSSDSQRAQIVAIDAASGRSLHDGELPVRLSDACAVLVGERVWLIGGRGSAGTVASVLD